MGQDQGYEPGSRAGAIIARYKDTFYAELARAGLEDVKKQQVAVAASPPAAKPSAPAKRSEPAAAICAGTAAQG